MDTSNPRIPISNGLQSELPTHVGYKSPLSGRRRPLTPLPNTPKLKPATDQPSLVFATLPNGKVSVGVEEGDTVRIFAKNFTKQEAEILKEKIKQGEDE